MCEPASFVVTKKQVFWSLKHDHHNRIIEENKLKERNVRGEYLFVRVEIVPLNRDYTLPPSKWVYKLDQDLRPIWYNDEDVELRCREELKEWRKQKLCLPGKKKTITDGHIICCGGTVEAWGNSTVEALDNSTVTASGNSAVEALDNSTVKALDNSTVKALDNSTVKALDNSTVTASGNSAVKALGNSTVTAWGNSTVEALDNSTVKASGNSAVKALGNSTVTAWGNSTVKALDNSTVKAWGNSTVKALDNSTVTAWDNSTVKALDNSTVQMYRKKLDNIKLSSNAVLIDRSGNKPICYVGKIK